MGGQYKIFPKKLRIVLVTQLIFQIFFVIPESVKLANPVYGLCLINTGRNTVLFPVSVFAQWVKNIINNYISYDFSASYSKI